MDNRLYNVKPLKCCEPDEKSSKCYGLYEIVNNIVKENGLFGKTLLKNPFTFSDDGAPIHEYSVSVEQDNKTVIIKIKGSEMTDKVFEVELES